MARESIRSISKCRRGCGVWPVGRLRRNMFVKKAEEVQYKMEFHMVYRCLLENDWDVEGTTYM